MRRRHFLIACLALLLGACAGTQPIKFPETPTVTRDTYAGKHTSEAVVLMDVNWGRKWNCGGFDNAQLIGIAFDLQPMPSLDASAAPSLVILNPGRLTASPVFRHYAFVLRPGVYALSAASIKLTRSASKVYFSDAQRSGLYKDRQPIGGTFTVQPGETVFIGNFYLDCTYAPTLWRYYPKTKAHFAHQLAEYKASFPFLGLGNVQYRLFKTEHFGRDHPAPVD
jgi:hypothetical protein